MSQTAQQTSVVQDAIAYYDQLLREAGLTEADYKAFQQAVIDAKVDFGGRSSCPYLRPQFVSAEQWAHVQKVSKLVCSALVKVGELVQKDPDLLAILCLTEGEKMVIEPDPGYPMLSPHARYDSFLTEDSYGFVEINGECPGGPAFTTQLANLWLEQPIMKQFMTQYEVTTFDNRQPTLQALLNCYNAWRANGHSDRREKPRIAIVDYDFVPTYSEFVLMRDYFQSQGYEAVVADPREMKYENGRLTDKHGFEVDLVFRRLLTNEFLERFDELQAFWNAYKDGAACFMNPFRAKLLHKKSVFAVLTDERVLPHFTAEEREAVRSSVPWTRLVAEGRTHDANGAEIDLVPWILENQQNLVMKPNDDYGGKGVYLGWTSSPEEWKAAVTEALKEPFVVQGRVRAPKLEFPLWGPEGLMWEEQTIDLDPYVTNGVAHGFLTRLANNDLCNVTAGGGIVPTFVIAKK